MRTPGSHMYPLLRFRDDIDWHSVPQPNLLLLDLHLGCPDHSSGAALLSSMRTCSVVLQPGHHGHLISRKDKETNPVEVSQCSSWPRCRIHCLKESITVTPPLKVLIALESKGAHKCPSLWWLVVWKGPNAAAGQPLTSDLECPQGLAQTWLG